jgi:NADH-quinone oxidoreductase subunit G
VLLAGFEPEEESPIVFLRLHKSTRLARTKVWSLAAIESGGLAKLGGTLLAAEPGAEAIALKNLPIDVTEALRVDGALILVGERLATAPGALSAAATLAATTGARLAWIPRRAGERGAIDAGAVPNLLPGGRLVADAAARADVEAVWGAAPKEGGRDADGIWRAAAEGTLPALVVGGVDPADSSDPALAGRALSTAGFIVSLEVRHSAVTQHADVVLPVAPPAEKAGRYVTWEGRRRPFEHVIKGTGAISDARVLNALAEEMDVELNLASLEAARAELLGLGVASTRPGVPTVPPFVPEPLLSGEVRLATWHELIDGGRMQDGDEHLAGTAKPVRARISAATAVRVGVVEGEDIAVTTDAGTIVVPVDIDDMVDNVVWLPTNARGYPVRAALGAVAGDTVRLVRPAAPPVVGVEEGQA